METANNRPVGYEYLIYKYGLAVVPNWHTSKIGRAAGLHSTTLDHQIESTYPVFYWPGETIGDHLEFALKYDGVNLGVLSAVFEAAPEDEITSYVRSKPTGKYSRRVWFLYEFLTGKELPLKDLGNLNYIEALDSDLYYTLAHGERIKRQKIIDNLLGTKEFCPIIRRTAKLKAQEQTDLAGRCKEALDKYAPDLIRRGLSYLYRKEAKSSFEIENVSPSDSRVEKFIGLLEMAEHRDYCEKGMLIEAQNSIVDPRFENCDYRTSQNYIGLSISLQKQMIHYVCPKPDDLDSLMNGLITANRRMRDGGVPPVVHAAAISYGFVFIHPFDDGNGRIHRFLIHNILSIRGAVPGGLMFPVSASMLKNPLLYDSSLEEFSKPVKGLVSYEVDDLGQMTVHGNTGRLYRYIDMTAQAEGLYDFVGLTIDHELAEEMDFLSSYDETRRGILEVVDMSDQLIDLFLRICLQGKGSISIGKRKSHFGFLTDEELKRMEEAVRKGFRT